MYGLRVQNQVFQHSLPARPTCQPDEATLRTPSRPFVSIFQKKQPGAGITASEECGWEVNIQLDKEGRSDDFDHVGSKWRSGEALRGKIQLSRVPGHLSPKKVQSLICRAFWQSTTVYAQGVVLNQGMSSRGPERTSTNFAEYHRGYLEQGGAGTELWDVADLVGIAQEVEALVGGTTSSQEVLSQETPEGEAAGAKSFDFVFVLPTTTHAAFSNPSAHPPINRGALMRHPRCPPPSFETADFRNGSVEWMVEVLLRTGEPLESSNATDATPQDLSSAPEELPSFRSAVEDGAEHDLQGLLISTSNLLVERRKFPFEPMDSHIQDMVSSWSDAAASTPVPMFGRDARDELGGTKLSSNAAEVSGREDQWTTYEKDFVLGTTGLVRSGGTLRCNVAIPFPAMITRHSETLPLVLRFTHTNKPSSFLSSSKTKQKPLFVDTVTFHLYERILTRSGRAERPTMVLNEVRRQAIKLMDSEDGNEPVPLSLETTRESRFSGRSRRSSNGGDDSRHLRVTPGGNAVEVQVAFDLQHHSILPASTTGDEFHRAPRAATPLRRLGLSFRTPNIEREYILLVQVQPVGHSEFQAVRVPIQLIAGDDDAAPDFEEVVAAEAGGLGRGERTERVGVEEGLPGYA